MSKATWLNDQLFIGQSIVGKVTLDAARGGWLAFSYLPGGRNLIGTYGDPLTARDIVQQSASSRIKAMFGAGTESTAAAVEQGKELRTVGRAIFRAGRWTCDRPVNTEAIFADLARALGMHPEDAPPRIGPAPPEPVDDGVFIE